MTTAALMGVDGGGTSTTAWLADAGGRVLGRGVAGPSNIRAIGAEAAKAGLDRSIRSAFADAGREAAPVEVACLGLAGYDRPEERRRLETWAAESSWCRRLLMVNDGDLVVAAGTPEGWGVGVIAGTGSIAVGRSRDGRTARSGGWGYLFGDEGSAYAVALAGLRTLARRVDGRDESPTGALGDRLCEALGIGGAGELVSAVYREAFDRAKLASLAPAVVAAGAVDADVISEILEPAGRELAQMVAAVAWKLNLYAGILPLAMAGSFLLNCPAASGALINRLNAAGYEVQASSATDPVEGALVLARRALNS